MHLNVQHAEEIGLLPKGCTERVQVVGNTSLAGAMVALLDRDSIGQMDTLRAKVQVVELNLEEDFEDRFVDNLALP